jgi:hypothetical protein
MKKSDLPPGTKVLASISDDEYGDNELVKYYYDQYNESTLTGTVVDNQASDLKAGIKQVVVIWDENDWRESEEGEIVNISLLTLETERSTVEKEFKAAAIAVKAKMTEAAKLVKEANTLAKTAHAKSLESMYDACRPLIYAMDSSGWNSSSWGC